MGMIGVGLRRWEEPLRRFRPEEWLFLALTTVLVAIMAYYGDGYSTLFKMLGNWRFAAIVGGMCLVIFLRGWWRHREVRGALHTVGRTLREFSPLWACMIIYETLHDLTPLLRPHVVDAHLIAIDHAVLGVDAGRWLNDHIGSPAMTEILVICYASYGFATPIYAAYLYLKDKTRPFRDLSLAITLTAVLGYIGYISVPAIGPYLFQKEIYPDRLPQWSADPGLLDTINNLKGTARDCFPSLHTAMTTVLMALMWKSARRMFWGYLPMALGLYLATLYLRVHYAVDIVAGFATAAIVLAVTPRINDWWYTRRATPKSVAEEHAGALTSTV
jgi:membrane-associated phospholipid phosphatase